MRSNQAGTGEVKVAIFQSGQEFRKLPRCTCYADAFVGHAFGEMEHADAVVKHRRARLLELEPPRIDFSQMGNELRLERVLAPNQLLETEEKLIACESV